MQVMLGAVAFSLSVENDRRPHLEGVEREIEVRPRHSDDGESFGVERQSLAHNARIGGEAADPEAMLEHDHLIAPRLVFTRLKRAAERRACAERVEEVGRHDAAAESLRIIHASQVKVLLFNGDESFEALTLLQKIIEIAWRDKAANEACLPLFPNHHQ